MDLGVTLISAQCGASEFHFRNRFPAHSWRVASTKTLFRCHAALRGGREALFFRPAMVFSAHALAGLQARLGAGAASGVTAAHGFCSPLVMWVLGNKSFFLLR
jgi:hypothetical protein